MIEKRRLILDESNDNEDMDENGSSDNEAVEGDEEVSQEGSASASGGGEPPAKRTRDQRAVLSEARKLGINY